MATTWVFPLAGQSNMVGRDDADGTSAWPDAVRFVTQEGGLIAPAAEIAAPEGNGGPYLIPKRFAAGFLATRPRDSIVFVPGAVGGTSFWNHRWNPGDDLYDNLVALTTAALARNPAWRLRAMLFQGFETDAKNAMLATTFRRALDRFVRAVRADLRAPELPIVFGELPAGLRRRAAPSASPSATSSSSPPRGSPSPPSPRAGPRASPTTTGSTTRPPASSASATASPPPSLPPRRTPSPRSSADRFRRMRRA